MINKDRVSISKLLDHKAEKLAQQHRRQLNEITEAALKSSSQHSSSWFTQPALAFASLVIAISVYWMLPSADSHLPPAPQMAIIPDWVLDDQVPLELLESPEFYQWLAEQEASQQG